MPETVEKKENNSKLPAFIDTLRATTIGYGTTYFRERIQGTNLPKVGIETLTETLKMAGRRLAGAAIGMGLFHFVSKAVDSNTGFGMPEFAGGGFVDPVQLTGITIWACETIKIFTEGKGIISAARKQKAVVDKVNSVIKPLGDKTQEEIEAEIFAQTPANVVKAQLSLTALNQLFHPNNPNKDKSKSIFFSELEPQLANAIHTQINLDLIKRYLDVNNRLSYTDEEAKLYLQEYERMMGIMTDYYETDEDALNSLTRRISDALYNRPRSGES